MRVVRGPISQESFAELLGCHHTWISRLETGQRMPSRAFVGKVCAEAGLSDAACGRLFVSAGFVPLAGYSVKLKRVAA